MSRNEIEQAVSVVSYYLTIVKRKS